jgi:hypothetical protein
MYSGGGWYDVELGLATRKTINGSGRYLINASNGNICSSESMSPTWVILYNSGDEYGPAAWTIARNPSQDFNNIPTTGWIIDDPSDASSITITAPSNKISIKKQNLGGGKINAKKNPTSLSGIPVASTSQIIVASTNSFIGSAPFNKISETGFENSLDGASILDYVNGSWTFYYDSSQIAFATSPAGYIPTSGYTIIDGGGSITITAA